MNSSSSSKRIRAVAIAAGVIGVGLIILFPGQPAGPRSQDLKHFDGRLVYVRRDSDPLRYGLYVQAGEALKAGNVKKAEAIYRRLVETSSNDPKAHEALGACLYFQTRYAEADSEYAQALRLDPQSVGALYGAACVAYAQGNDLAAKGYLEKALSIDSRDAAYHRLFGLVYEQLGDNSNALVQLKTAVEMDPAIGKEPKIKARLEKLRGIQNR